MYRNCVKSNKAALPTGGHGELILVIDDEEALLDLAKMMLERRGYVVITAHNGLEGIARFKENPDEIKLIITDSDMPHLNGTGVIRAIRELKPDIPVILSSGFQPDTAEFQKNDPVRLQSLEKPFSLDQLLTAVEKGLHH